MAGASTSGRGVIKAMGKDILAAAGACDMAAVEAGVVDDLSVVSFKVGSHDSHFSAMGGVSTVSTSKQVPLSCTSAAPTTLKCLL